MRHDLKLSEKLFCLSIHPVNGGIMMRSSWTLAMTLTGLVFSELRSKGLISIENEQVHLVNPSFQTDEIHEFFLTPLRLRAGNRRIRRWISYFNFRGRRIKKLFIRTLVKKYVLRIEEKHFLFIPYDKVYLMDRDLVESLRKELESIMLGKTEPDKDALFLAMMAFKNNLIRRIIPEKELRAEASRNMGKLPETDLSKAVQQAINMARAAAIAAST